MPAVKLSQGQKRASSELWGWMTSFEESELKCALVVGDHGVGKRVVVDAATRDAGLNKREVTYQDGDKIRGRKGDVVVIRGRGGSLDNAVESVVRSNQASGYAPVVVVSDNKHSKLLTTLKRLCRVVQVPRPTPSDSIAIVQNAIMGMGLKLDEKKTMDLLVGHVKGMSASSILVLVREMGKYFDGSTAKYDEVMSFLGTLGDKGKDPNIYDDTSLLFERGGDISASLSIFERNRSIMPLMVQQNFPTMVRLVKGSHGDACRIADSLAKGDVVDNFVYSTQSWDLQSTHGLYSCSIPSYIINRSMGDGGARHWMRYKYPVDLNKTSTKKINAKNVSNAGDGRGDLSAEDCVYVSKVAKELVKTGGKGALKGLPGGSVGVGYALRADKMARLDK